MCGCSASWRSTRSSSGSTRTRRTPGTTPRRPTSVRELIEDQMYPLTLQGLEEGMRFLSNQVIRPCGLFEPPGHSGYRPRPCRRCEAGRLQPTKRRTTCCRCAAPAPPAPTAPPPRQALRQPRQGQRSTPPARITANGLPVIEQDDRLPIRRHLAAPRVCLRKSSAGPDTATGPASGPMRSAGCPGSSAVEGIEQAQAAESPICAPGSPPAVALPIRRAARLIDATGA